MSNAGVFRFLGIVVQYTKQLSPAFPSSSINATYSAVQSLGASSKNSGPSHCTYGVNTCQYVLNKDGLGWSPGPQQKITAGFEYPPVAECRFANVGSSIWSALVRLDTYSVSRINFHKVLGMHCIDDPDGFFARIIRSQMRIALGHFRIGMPQQN